MFLVHVRHPIVTPSISNNSNVLNCLYINPMTPPILHYHAHHRLVSTNLTSILTTFHRPPSTPITKTTLLVSNHPLAPPHPSPQAKPSTFSTLFLFLTNLHMSSKPYSFPSFILYSVDYKLQLIKECIRWCN